MNPHEMFNDLKNSEDIQNKISKILDYLQTNIGKLFNKHFYSKF